MATAESKSKPTFGELRSELEKKYDRRLVTRVHDGIELLKQEYGEDFADHIDPKKLDMANGEHCVIGQLFGGWGRHRDRLGISDGNEYADAFIATSRDPFTFRDLDNIWQDVLKALRS